jgi:hypothetical protein
VYVPPHWYAGHPVAGAQHWSPGPQCVAPVPFDAHVFAHVSVLPVQGSVNVPPHWFAGHCCGVQQ